MCYLRVSIHQLRIDVIEHGPDFSGRAFGDLIDRQEHRTATHERLVVTPGERRHMFENDGNELRLTTRNLHKRLAQKPFCPGTQFRIANSPSGGRVHARVAIAGFFSAGQTKSSPTRHKRNPQTIHSLETVASYALKPV